MQEYLHALPEAPVSSVDWRLLVPFTDHCRILVGGDKAQEIASYLSMLGTNATVWQAGGNRAEDVVSSHAPTPFDIVVIPLGFSEDRFAAKPLQRVDDFSVMYHLLRPGGSLLIGFSNQIGLRRSYFRKGGFSISPGEMMYLLTQANFVSIRFYGVISQLKIPRYIFPLKRQTLDYAFRNHFRRKLPGFLLRLVRVPIMLPLLRNILPSYYVIATTPGRA